MHRSPDTADRAHIAQGTRLENNLVTALHPKSLHAGEGQLPCCPALYLANYGNSVRHETWKCGPAIFEQALLTLKQLTGWLTCV